MAWNLKRVNEYLEDVREYDRVIADPAAPPGWRALALQYRAEVYAQVRVAPYTMGFPRPQYREGLCSGPRPLACKIDSCARGFGPDVPAEDLHNLRTAPVRWAMDAHRMSGTGLISRL